MKTKYTATFSNGEVITRKTDRTYTHAWLLIQTAKNGQVWRTKGFSGAQDLAAKALAASVSTNMTTDFSEVVAVVEG